MRKFLLFRDCILANYMKLNKIWIVIVFFLTINSCESFLIFRWCKRIVFFCDCDIFFSFHSIMKSFYNSFIQSWNFFTIRFIYRMNRLILLKILNDKRRLQFNYHEFARSTINIIFKFLIDQWIEIFDKIIFDVFALYIYYENSRTFLKSIIDFE